MPVDNLVPGYLPSWYYFLLPLTLVLALLYASSFRFCSLVFMTFVVWASWNTSSEARTAQWLLSRFRRLPLSWLSVLWNECSVDGISMLL